MPNTRILLTLLLLCTITCSLNAQKLDYNGVYLLFREAKTKQPVLIVNDSLVYKGFAMNKIAFKHTEYFNRLQEYEYYNIGTKTYLVHEGCGPVLEFRNDSIVRIDNSFLHRNQYGAAKFVYRNEIYFFGGYGLFTCKNILTKFNFQTREWIEIKTFSDSPIENRTGATWYLSENNLYLFGGYNDSPNKPSLTKINNILWKLNLPTMRWSKEGEVNITLQQNNSQDIWIDNNKKRIVTLSSTYNKVDFKKNSVERYERKFFSQIYPSYLEGDSIVGLSRNENNKTLIFSVTPVSILKGKLLETSIFIKPLPNNKRYIFVGLFLSILCVGLFISRKKIISALKPFNGIVYNHQKELFFYNRKPITIFEKQESQLLLFLIEQNKQFVSLNDLNQLFENGTQPETISAIVKRREQIVSGLLLKVSKITGIEQEELYFEFKSDSDKRIKNIKILPNLLKSI